MNEYIYERLARKFTEQISRGLLRVGDKLPSVRAICRQEGVSTATAMQALTLLEARGLIEARPRSGFYVRWRKVRESPTPESSVCSLEPTVVGVSDIAADVFKAASDPNLVALGTAIPASDLLPMERISRYLAAAARTHSETIGRYDITVGYPPLIRQLALRFARMGCDVPQDEIVITIGTMEALNLALRAVAKAGDIIAVESPCYFGILEIIESLGLKAIAIPATDDSGVDLKLLESALEKHPIKAFILNSNFSNPSGHCMRPEDRMRMMQLLEDHGIPCIEDDNYGELVHCGERPKPLKGYGKGCKVIHCASFSKTLSPGLRVGWIAAGEYAERVRRLKYISTVATPMIPQIALSEFLESESYDRHLRKLRSALCTQTAQTSEAILSAFPPGTRVSQPGGGCALWVQLPPSVNAMDLHAAALNDGISIAPGQLFCPHGKSEDRIRITTGQPFDSVVDESIKVLGAHVQRLAQQALQVV
ncbi:MAG: PLP-dependent aminotransferase family protein [Verrucomicrobiota bacterium]